MKSVGRQFLSGIRAGSYATQSASKAKVEQHKLQTTPQDVKVTKLPNGVIVASLENYSPLSRISVLYNTGSRHEPAEQLGITHCLRAASALSTQKKSAFLLAKELQQVGGNLTCTTTREQVEYTVDCLRRDLGLGLQTLGHVTTMPAFKPWEVEGLDHKLKLDLELLNRCPDSVLLELLHKAAYRDALGHSLYMHPNKIGSFSPKSLESFVQSRYVSQGAAVAGIGVDHDQLVHLVKKINFHQGTPAADKKAKYHGGELRSEMKIPLVHAAFVTEGVSLSSNDLITMGVLQMAIGTGPYVKYGNNLASSKITKAALSATNQPFSASCINISYSDSGLFGFYVVANAKDIRKVLTSVTGAMTQVAKGSITDADLQRAKKQLKAALHTWSESAESLLDGIANQALFARQFVPFSSIDTAVDKVTVDDVNKLAKKVINGKPTLALVGDLSNAPYLDELVSLPRNA